MIWSVVLSQCAVVENRFGSIAISNSCNIVLYVEHSLLQTELLANLLLT